MDVGIVACSRLCDRGARSVYGDDAKRGGGQQRQIAGTLDLGHGWQSRTALRGMRPRRRQTSANCYRGGCARQWLIFPLVTQSPQIPAEFQPTILHRVFSPNMHCTLGLSTVFNYILLLEPSRQRVPLWRIDSVSGHITEWRGSACMAKACRQTRQSNACVHIIRRRPVDGKRSTRQQGQIESRHRAHHSVPKPSNTSTLHLKRDLVYKPHAADSASTHLWYGGDRGGQAEQGSDH